MHQFDLDSSQCFNKRCSHRQDNKDARARACVCVRVCVDVRAREQRGDIDINRGQGRAGACFVIRAPLTSKVVNLLGRCPDQRRSRLSPTFRAVLLSFFFLRQEGAAL